VAHSAHTSLNKNGHHSLNGAGTGEVCQWCNKGRFREKKIHWGRLKKRGGKKKEEKGERPWRKPSVEEKDGEGQKAWVREERGFKHSCESESTVIL